MANGLKLYVVHSFFTSPNSCQCSDSLASCWLSCLTKLTTPSAFQSMLHSCVLSYHFVSYRSNHNAKNLALPLIKNTGSGRSGFSLIVRSLITPDKLSKQKIPHTDFLHSTLKVTSKSVFLYLTKPVESVTFFLSWKQTTIFCPKVSYSYNCRAIINRRKHFAWTVYISRCSKYCATPSF